MAVEYQDIIIPFLEPQHVKSVLGKIPNYLVMVQKHASTYNTTDLQTAQDWLKQLNKPWWLGLDC